jgi:hypothetical protein
MKLRSSLLLAAAAGSLLPAPSAQAGGPNIAVCMTLANAYNQCIRDQQRQPQPRYGGGYGGGYDRDEDDGPGYGRPPQGGGYGGRGYNGNGGGYGQGYGQGWDRDYWRQQRRPRPNNAQQACMSWLIQMKAANCY